MCIAFLQVEMAEPQSFKFEDNNSSQVSILKSDLEKYPKSFLNLLTIGNFQGDYHNGTFKVGFNRNTLSLVAHFYQTGKWANLYIEGNQLDIDDVTGCIEDVCEFLGLPSEPMEDPEEEFFEEEEEFDDYDYYDDESSSDDDPFDVPFYYDYDDFSDDWGQDEGDLD